MSYFRIQHFGYCTVFKTQWEFVIADLHPTIESQSVPRVVTFHNILTILQKNMNLYLQKNVPPPANFSIAIFNLALANASFSKTKVSKKHFLC